MAEGYGDAAPEEGMAIAAELVNDMLAGALVDVTVRLNVPTMLDWDAVMVLLPDATAVTSPVLLIVATVGTDDTQATVVVRFWVELSLKVPVAVSCSIWPTAMEFVADITARETSWGAVTVSTPLTKAIA
jgi:hypothetical protein